MTGENAIRPIVGGMLFLLPSFLTVTIKNKKRAWLGIPKHTPAYFTAGFYTKVAK